MDEGTTRFRHPALWLSLAVGSILVVSAESSADLIRYEYSGVITEASASAKVPVGTRFTGIFAYDPAEKALTTSDSSAQYTQFGRVFGGIGTPDSSGLTAKIGDSPFYEQHGGLALANYRPGFSGNGSTPAQADLQISSRNFADLPQFLVALDFINKDHPVYSTLGPPTSIRLSDFTSAEFLIRSDEPGLVSSTLYRGTIDSLTPIPTPEPSAAILLGVAALGWLARPRVRRPS